MVTRTPGDDVTGRTPLPREFDVLATEFPWAAVAARSREYLREAFPPLADATDGLSAAVFGLSSGFFYLPAALSREWKTDINIHDLLTTVALGHVYFAFQDGLVDSGDANPALCLLSHEALLAYLERVTAMLPGPNAHEQVLAMHRRYYSDYVAALCRDARHREQLRAYLPDEVVGLGAKAAPGNTVLQVIAVRAGRSRIADALVASVMDMCAGLQLLDDLNDLVVDRRDGNLTLPLTMVLSCVDETGLVPEQVADQDLELVAITGGVVDAVCSAAVILFDQARERGLMAGTGTVADLAEVWTRRATSRRDDARRARRSIHTELNLPVTS